MREISEIGFVGKSEGTLLPRDGWDMNTFEIQIFILIINVSLEKMWTSKGWYFCQTNQLRNFRWATDFVAELTIGNRCYIGQNYVNWVVH